MFNINSETVIGRYGLVEQGVLLWKVGVQPVQEYQEKLVNFFPQFAHPSRGKLLQLPFIPTSVETSPTFTGVKSTRLSTDKNAKTTVIRKRFSPLSTPPITTTTTYI